MKKIYQLCLLLLVSLSTQAQVFDVDTLVWSGPSTNRVNIVIMGDGYTSTEQAKFITDATKVANAFFLQTPYKEYKKYINVLAVKVISNQSGAGHPKNSSDNACGTQPAATVDNYFGSSFDCGGGSYHRLLCASKSSKITTVLASNWPDYDQGLVIVNTPYYGGAGGQYAVASTEASSTEICIHEVGHSYAGLADEYWAGSQYATNGKPNMTSNGDINTVKWKAWNGVNNVGVYQYNGGAGWYRPVNGTCKMEYLGTGYPFCPVCRETHVMKFLDMTKPYDGFTPANTATITASTNTNFTINSVDPNPNTLRIKWTLNGTVVKNNAKTYTLPVASLQAGNNTLTATLYDTTSYIRATNHPTNHTYTIQWTIKPATNTPPAVSVTSPTANATFTAPATVNIAANATDSDGTITKVEFFNGTTKLGEDLTSPYTYSWTNVAAGTYSITAKATDNSGAITTSTVVSITVKNPNVAPTVSITAPANNAVYVTAPASINITANATDSDGTITKVEFFNGGTKLGEDLTSPYTYSWTSVAAGTYSITAKATDNSNAVTTSTAITVKVNAAPTISITAPANNANFTAPATVNIAANATDSDGTITKVEFFNGTTKLGEDLTSPYTYSWTSVAAGTYSITAKATDNSGAITTSTAVSITVNPPANIAPTVSIIAPANNANFTAPATVNIAANATDSDGTITKVEFYNGTTKLGEDLTSPYTYSWTNVAAGTYSITAKATDNSGAITTSTAVSITVNPPANIAPTVSITAPANNANFTAPATVNIAANATDSDGTITKVEFYNGGTKLGEDLTSPYEFSWTNVAAGTYALIAKAYDNIGAVNTSSTISVTVNQAPTGTENCASIAAWNANSVYVNGDFVTYQNFKYKAKWWTQNNNPATSSGQWDVWEKLGECIAGTAPSPAPAISMTPANGTTIALSQALSVNVTGLSNGSISEVNYIFYKDKEKVTLISKTGSYNSDWTATESGKYLLQVIVKDQSGMLIFSDAKEITVTQTTTVNDGLIKNGSLLYPNPTTGIVNLHESVQEVTVTDLAGKTLGHYKLNGSPTVDLSGYTNGTYLLKLQTGSQTSLVKVVKE